MSKKVHSPTLRAGVLQKGHIKVSYLEEQNEKMQSKMYTASVGASVSGTDTWEEQWGILFPRRKLRKSKRFTQDNVLLSLK